MKSEITSTSESGLTLRGARHRAVTSFQPLSEPVESGEYSHPTVHPTHRIGEARPTRHRPTRIVAAPDDSDAARPVPLLLAHFQSDANRHSALIGGGPPGAPERRLYG